MHIREEDEKTQFFNKYGDFCNYYNRQLYIYDEQGSTAQKECYKDRSMSIQI